MPSPWTDATERKLLLTIIHLTMPKLPDWDAVAVLMGEGFTPSASRQHFQKMRKECKEKFGEPGEVPEGAAAKGTPRSRPLPSTPVKTPAKSTAQTKERSKTPNGEKSAGKRKDYWEVLDKSTGKRKGREASEDRDDTEEEGPSMKKVSKTEAKEEED